jgi:hypothetical protein
MLHALLLALLASPAPIPQKRIDLRIIPEVRTGHVALFATAERKIALLAEKAQHLGSRRQDVWVTPWIGSTMGAEVRFVLP